MTRILVVAIILAIAIAVASRGCRGVSVIRGSSVPRQLDCR